MILLRNTFNAMLSLFWIMIGLLAYNLPWVVNPGAGLTMGAYDLAEWASLHPAVRSESPTLLTPFLLRLPVLCLALLVILTMTNKKYSRFWWMALAIFSLIWFYSLPPLEFVTSARSDSNYRQQFIMTMIIGIIGGMILMGYLRRWNRHIVITVSFLGIGASMWGLVRVYNLIFDLSIPLRIGAGIFLLIAIFIGALWGELILFKGDNLATLK